MSVVNVSLGQPREDIVHGIDRRPVDGWVTRQNVYSFGRCQPLVHIADSREKLLDIRRIARSKRRTGVVPPDLTQFIERYRFAVDILIDEFLMDGVSSFQNNGVHL